MLILERKKGEESEKRAQLKRDQIMPAKNWKIVSKKTKSGMIQ